MNKLIGVLLATVFLANACSTISLDEKDAFDIKRTISPEWFVDKPYDFERVRMVSGDSLTLQGWYIQSPQSRGTVLYMGGNGFAMVTSYHIILSIIRQNVDLLVFDYRGYGENPGRPTVEGVKEDGQSAYEFLVEDRQIDPGNIILHGHSMGSFIASFIASEREAAGLVLECPITDARDWTGRLVPWFLKPFIRFDIDPALLENSNVEWLSRINIPLLIIAGEADQVTPPGMAEELYQAAASEQKQLILIENGGHNNLPNTEKYAEALNQFYRRIH